MEGRPDPTVNMGHGHVPDSSHQFGVHGWGQPVNQPLLPWRSKDIIGYDTADLATYLELRGAGSNTLEVVITQGWVGSIWAETIANEDPATAEEDQEMWSAFWITPVLLRRRLRAEAKNAMRDHDRDQREQALARQDERTKAYERMSAEAKERSESGSDAGQSRLTSRALRATMEGEHAAKPSVGRVKVEYAPKLPSGLHEATVDAASSFQVYCKALGAWIMPYSPNLSKHVKAVAGGAKQDQIKEMLNTMNGRDQTIDQELLGQLYGSASPPVQAKLFEDETRQVGGKPTTMMMLAALLGVVEHASEHTRDLKVNSWIMKPSLVDPWELSGAVEVLKRESEQLIRIGATEDERAMFPLLTRAINKMLAKILLLPELHMILALPVHMCKTVHKNDPKALLAVVADCAKDIDALPRPPPDRQRHLGDGKGGGGDQLMYQPPSGGHGDFSTNSGTELTTDNGGRALIPLDTGVTSTGTLDAPGESGSSGE